MKAIAILTATMVMLFTYQQSYPQDMFKTIEISTNNNPQAVEKKIFKENEFLKVDVRVPNLTGIKNNEAQELINTSINEWTEMWIKDVEDIILKYFNEDKNLAPQIPYELKAIYTVTYCNDKIISFYIDYYQYTGGAHGITTRKAYNIDLKSGKQLLLKDLFKKDYDYKAIIDNEIISIINSNKEIYFDEGSIFKGIKDDEKFYINQDSIVVYYGLYEIAPYVTGIPTFEINKNIFKDKYIYK